MLLILMEQHSHWDQQQICLTISGASSEAKAHGRLARLAQSGPVAGQHLYVCHVDEAVPVVDGPCSASNSHEHADPDHLNIHKNTQTSQASGCRNMRPGLRQLDKMEPCFLECLETSTEAHMAAQIHFLLPEPACASAAEEPKAISRPIIQLASEDAPTNHIMLYCNADVKLSDWVAS